MAKHKRKASAEEAQGVYRCPKCGHRWKQTLNFHVDCPKCGETQGPVSIW